MLEFENQFFEVCLLMAPLCTHTFSHARFRFLLVVEFARAFIIDTCKTTVKFAVSAQFYFDRYTCELWKSIIFVFAFGEATWSSQVWFKIKRAKVKNSARQ